jgi:hypothetical protein
MKWLFVGEPNLKLAMLHEEKKLCAKDFKKNKICFCICQHISKLGLTFNYFPKSSKLEDS